MAVYLDSCNDTDTFSILREIRNIPLIMGQLTYHSRFLVVIQNVGSVYLLDMVFFASSGVAVRGQAFYKM